MSVNDAVRARELLKVLSSDVNLKIITLLGKLGGSNPRELAKMLNMCESDVSRRLSKLRKLGLVNCKWVRIGNKNVKVFKLKVREIAIDLIEGKITSSKEFIIKFSDELITKYLGGKIPEVKFFIGRSSELEKLRRSKSSLIVVTGIHGIGKTFLVANYLREYAKGPVYWLNVSEADHVEGVIRRLAIYLSSLGHDELINYVNSGGRDVDIISGILADALSSLNIYLVIDDYHKVSDFRIKELITLIANKVRNGKLIVISRKVPNELITSVHNNLHLRLSGLNLKEAKNLLKELGIKLSDKEFTEVYASTRGHPLLLKMFAEVVENYGINEALKALSSGDLPKSLWLMIHKSLRPEERELLRILSCVNEPLSPELLRELVSSRHVIEYLYTLEDYGLIENFGGVFNINDLIRHVVSMISCNKVCIDVYRALSNVLIESLDFNDLIKGLHYCVKSKDERTCIRGLKRRYWSIRYGLLEYLQPYYDVLKSLNKVIKDTEGLAYLSIELGLVLYNLGRKKESLQYLLRAKELFNSLGDDVMSINTSAMLIISYLELGEINLARKYVDESIQRLSMLEEKVKDPTIIGYTGFGVHANAARYFSEVGDISRCYEEVVEESRYAEISEDPFLKSLSRFHLAVVKNLMGFKEEVLEPLIDSYLGFREAGSKSFAAQVAMVLSKVLFELGRLGDALRYVNESLTIFKELKHLGNICDPVAIRALINIELGNIDDAIRELNELRSKCSTKGVSSLFIAALIMSKALKGMCNEARELMNNVGEDLLRKAIGDTIFKKVSEALNNCLANPHPQ